MSDAHKTGSRVGWLFAVVVLGGAAAGWSAVVTTPDLPRWLAQVGGGLTPRETGLSSAAQQIDGLAPPTAEVVVLSSDPEDAAFARYLLYPRVVDEAAVRPRSRRDAALDALHDGALVLVADESARADLAARAAPAAGAPHFEPTWTNGDVSLFRVRR